MNKSRRPGLTRSPSVLAERIVARLAALGWLALDGRQIRRAAREQSRAALRMARSA